MFYVTMLLSIVQITEKRFCTLEKLDYRNLKYFYKMKGPYLVLSIARTNPVVPNELSYIKMTWMIENFYRHAWY